MTCKQHTHTFLLAVLAAFALGQATASAFEQPKVYELKPKDHVVIFGDSTTVAGCKPAGFVQLLIQAVAEQIHDQGVKVSAICKNTRTTSSLLGPEGWILGRKFKTLQDAEHKPTVAIIVLGLNDSKAGPSGVEPYVKRLREAIGLLRDRKQTVILVTPSTWGGLEQTKPYAGACRALAKELECLLIDLYAVHVDHIVANTKDGRLLPSDNPTVDGVHYSEVGDTLTAGAILRALGLEAVWRKYQLQVALNRNCDVTVEPNLSVNEPYEPGAKVTLTCKPKAGMVFKSWAHTNGELIAGTEPAVTVTMDSHQHIKAVVEAATGQ